MREASSALRAEIPTTPEVSDAQLRDLEGKVQRALETGDDSELDIMGYGEVTVILRLQTDRGELACKRLPVFPTRARFERYRDTLDDYIQQISAAGVLVAPSELWSMDAGGGRVVAYCIQGAYPAAAVANRFLRDASEKERLSWLSGVIDATTRTVTPQLGLDVQSSNWVVHEGRLVYIDVTTPFQRDARGRELLDVKLFMSSLPWALREPVRLTLSSSIFDKFYTARSAMLDLLGNLHKERLGHLVPELLPHVNAALDQPISETEVRAYYDGDARLWTLIQGLRRADRWWQRTVRRRPYPFLLPGAIER